MAQPAVPRILVLSGVSGSGKTTLCARVVELARAQGLVVGGVLSRPRYDGGCKVGIDVEDLRTGRLWPLAERDDGTDGPTTTGWHFHAAGLEAGRAALLGALPCHLLVVDELGPLELLRADGWHAGLGVLASGEYRLGLAVVRPALVGCFRDQLGVQELPVLPVRLDRCQALAERILSELGDAG